MMLTRFVSRVALVAAVLVPAACSSISVSTDYDPDTDFSGLATFAWIAEEPQPDQDPRAGNPLISARVTEAVEATLLAAGYEQVEAEPDFLVAFALGVQRGVSVTTEPTGGYYGRYGYGRSGYGYGYGYGSTTEVREYEEGVLQIDIVGRESNKLLWRGTAKAVLRSNQSPEESTSRINEAVAKVLGRFPPR